jgi:hypothetical protein
MKQDKNKTDVIFRKFKEGDIIAMFPAEPGTNDIGTCMSYQHIGQHGNCQTDIISVTKLATDEERADLKAELESIGYNLREMKKITKYHFRKRQEELKR